MKLKWILRQNNRILSSGETQGQEIHLKAVTEEGAAAVLYAEIDLSFQPEYVFCSKCVFLTDKSTRNTYFPTKYVFRANN